MKSHQKANVPFEVIANKLTVEDAPDFWKVALDVLADEFMRQHDEKPTSRDWVLEVGACSHWVRPHNSRWNAAGGFAYPDGYHDSSPEYDWSVILVSRGRKWLLAKKLPKKKVMVFRVAIPARTARHKQAVVHTRWFPGGETVLHGFRNVDGNWECVAASDEKKQGRIRSRSSRTR